MKFTDIKRVRNLEVGVPVYTQNTAGEFGMGKLVSETRNNTGTVYTFEKALFMNEHKDANQPIKQQLVTDIVAIRKIDTKKESSKN